MAALLGRKIGMTQIFDDAGVVHAVTVLAMGPCHVLQVRTQEKDGYDAIQIGFGDKKRSRSNRAERGHVAGAGCEPKRLIREVRLEQPATETLGQVLTVEAFQDVPVVDVIGTMKGRGYSGTTKRHGFSGLETGHGVQRKHRAPGSIGCHTSPGRVIKGRRMNGQYGASRSTVRNLRVFRVDAENGCILVEGGVPGPTGGFVMVRHARRPGKKGRAGGEKA